MLSGHFLVEGGGSARGGSTAESGQGYMQKMLLFWHALTLSQFGSPGKPGIVESEGKYVRLLDIRDL